MGTNAEDVKPWDIGALSIIFLGLDLAKGLGEGEGTLKIEKDADDFDDAVGADGSVVRTRTHDDRYTITLSLLQTSKVNLTLTALRILDTEVPTGAGVGPFLVKNGLGADVFFASQSWIKGPPKSVEWGPKAGNREWVFRCADGKQIVGGS